MSRRLTRSLFSWAKALAARARRRTATTAPPPEGPPEAPTKPRAEAPADAPAQAPTQVPPDTAPEPPPDARREILARLDSWLTETLADEPPPPGLDPDTLAAFGVDPAQAQPPEPRADRVSLWSALTALTHEVKLQGRAFKKLDESLSPLVDWGDRILRVEQAQRQLGASVQAATAELRRQAEAAQRVQRTESQAVEKILMDLYDRLQRGLDSSRRCLDRIGPPQRPGLWSRILRRGEDAAATRAAVEALAGGHGLTLARLLEALGELDMTPVGEAGDMFDPHTMATVSVVECDGRPQGTILEVYASGFVRGGEVLRTAKVSVAAADRPGERRTASPSDGPQPPRPGSFTEHKGGAPGRPEPLEHAL